MPETSAPLVSVIIPVYNSMPYLTATMESILAQDLSDLEVIAVDDGSTDGSGSELDRFAEIDERITVMHQPNSGWPGTPRNRGLERARGEFVLFMDADDTIAPHALRALTEMAAERDADIVIPRFEGVAGRRVQSLFLRHPHGDIGLPRAMETLSPQKLFRREMIERDGLRFPEGRVRLEDGIFVTRAYVLARRIVFYGRDPLYFIALRDDGKNISASPIDPENYVGSCRRIAEILIEGVPDPARAETLVRQFFTRKGLRFYAPKRWLAMDDERRRRWAELHREFLADLVLPEYDARGANPTDRRKMRLIRAGDVAGLDELISAEPALRHTAGLLGADEVPGGVEVSVELAPADSGSLLREARIPSAVRLRAADLLHRALRPSLRWRAGRGASRRLTRAVAGPAPKAHLVLAGRRVGRGVSIPGRITGHARESGALRYRFVLPRRLLGRFHGDRVDLWTVAEVRPGLSGGQVRVRSAAPAGSRVSGIRVYSTNRGNVSLDLRAKAPK